jgi:predicted Zn finger-like uncharacterized protein
MKIECPKCGAKGQVEDVKVPDGGIDLRCPRCSERFFARKDRPEERVLHLSDAQAPQDLQQPLAMKEPPPQDTVETTPMSFKEKCSVCKGTFSRTDMIRFGETWVCASCKSSYLQMLQQGLRRPGEMPYAGFWIRFGAKFLDGLIVGVVNLLIALPLAVAAVADRPGLVLAGFVIQMLLAFVVPASYETFFLGKYRATLGKMACGLVVVTDEGGRVSYMRALGRYFGTMLSGVILCVGYIMAAFDQEKRALHDHICNTRVIYK